MWTTQTFSISISGYFAFLSLVHWNSTPFPSEFPSHSLVSWLTVWHSRPSWWPTWAVDMPSSLSLVISSFWFRVGAVWLFLSSTLQSHCKTVSGLHFNLCLCLREPRGLTKGGRNPVGTRSPFKDQVHYLTRACTVMPHDNDNGNIRGSVWMTNIMENFEISPELPKHDLEASSEQTLLVKWVSDSSGQGCHRLSIC